MKAQIWGIFCALLLCSCAAQHVQLPSPEPIRHSVVAAQGSTKEAQTKISQAQASVTAAQNKVKDAQQNIVKLQKELVENKVALTLANAIAADEDALTDELVNTQSALRDSQSNLVDTQTSLTTATGQVTQLSKQLNAQQSKIDKAMKDEAKYHQLKFLVCSLAAGLVALIAFHFGALALGYVGLGILIGAPTIVFTFLWFKL